MANIAEICLVLVLAFVVVTTGNPFFGGGFFFNGCHFKRCRRYAKCMINEKHRAVCVCPKPCPKSYEPVCGTDWKTYNNYCELAKKSCDENSATLRVRYYGPCKSGSCRFTRWHSLRCPYYSKCELNYGLPRCVCQQEFCQSSYKPVCGSDGRTYRNSCELRKTGCKQRKRLYVKHPGHCRPDPCARIDCCCGAQCRVNETNHARCQCNLACTLQFDPVCGSDGRTYGNACGLSSAACAQQNPKLVVVSNGQCPTVAPDVTTSPRTTLQTSPEMTSTNTQESTTLAWTPSPSPLRVTSHPEVTTPTPVPETTTPTASMTLSPCSVIKCGFFAKCEVINGSAACTCPSLCAAVHSLVCGSNGVTYGNVCELQRDSCKNKQFIKVAHEGPCLKTVPFDPCSGVKCGFHARCEVNNGSARCVCPSICLHVHNLMCGSDGVTYGNLCELNKASCEQKKHIEVVKSGVCGPTLSCPIPRICHISCDKEECAKNGQICCCRGCGNVCTTPIKLSGRALCPPNDDQCLMDESCPGGKKCCLDGCSKRCVNPVVSVDTEF